MATHILPGVQDGEVTPVQQLAGGRSAALFAVLAGVSLVLVAGTARPLAGRRWWGFAAGVGARAVLIGALGLALGDLDTGIAVILAYYAVLFLLAAPFLRLSQRALVWWTASWFVLAPVVSHLLRRRLPDPTYAVPSTDSLGDLPALATDLLVTGYYPALSWLPYLLVGVLVGRADLRRPRTAVLLAVGGALTAAAAYLASAWLVDRPGVADELWATFTGAGRLADLDTTLTHGLYGTTPTGSWWWLAVAAPHTGTTFDLLQTTGSALVVLGLALLAGQAVPRLVGVLFGAGAMTLTLYSLHVLARTEGMWDGDDLTTFLAQTGVALAVGAAYALAGRRGPFEAFVGWCGSGARRVVGGRGR